MTSPVENVGNAAARSAASPAKDIPGAEIPAAVPPPGVAPVSGASETAYKPVTPKLTAPSGLAPAPATFATEAGTALPLGVTAPASEPVGVDTASTAASDTNGVGPIAPDTPTVEATNVEAVSGPAAIPDRTDRPAGNARIRGDAASAGRTAAAEQSPHAVDPDNAQLLAEAFDAFANADATPVPAQQTIPVSERALLPAVENQADVDAEQPADAATKQIFPDAPATPAVSAVIVQPAVPQTVAGEPTIAAPAPTAESAVADPDDTTSLASAVPLFEALPVETPPATVVQASAQTVHQPPAAEIHAAGQGNGDAENAQNDSGNGFSGEASNAGEAARIGPPTGGPPHGPENAGNQEPEGEYNPRALLVMATQPEYVLSQLPPIVAHMRDLIDLSESSLPFEIKVTVQDLLQKTPFTLMEQLYTYFAQEQAWFYPETEVLRPLEEIIEENDLAFALWNNFLQSGEVPRDVAIGIFHSAFMTNLLTVYLNRDVPLHAETEELDAGLRLVPFQLAQKLFPQMTDEEAKLLFGSKTARDVRRLAQETVDNREGEQKRAAITRIQLELHPQVIARNIEEETSKTFLQLMDAFGITLVEDVVLLDPALIKLLMHPAGAVRTDDFIGDKVLDQRSMVLAEAVLEQAKRLQRTGDIIIHPHERELIDILRVHDIVRTADALDEETFWTRLTRLTEYDLTPSEMSDVTIKLYREWKARYIFMEKARNSLAVLDVAGLDAYSPLPEAIRGVIADIKEGHIAYDSIDALLLHIQKFFVPEAPRNLTISDEETENPLPAFEIDYLHSHLVNEYDQALMTVLTDAIHRWASGNEKTPFVALAEADLPPDSRFNGYRIEITRFKNGYHLVLHDPDLPGLLKTEDFAAFSKKQVTYTDDLLVKIITNPKDPLISSDIVGTTLVSTSISLKEIADYFGAIAGFNEKEKARFINEVLTQRHSGALFERPFLRKNGVKYILTEGLRRLEQGAFPYDESTGEVSGLADIIADPQRFQFYARQIGLAIMGNNAEELNELSQIFKALTIVTQHNGIIELPLSDESD